MNWAAIVWLVLLVFFLWAEAASVTITSLWFAIGALVAMLASLLGAQLWLQIVLFVAVSGVLLLLLRPILRKHFTPRITRTNVDAIIGAQGIVTGQIDNLQSQGTVKLGAVEWSARSTAGDVIQPGTQVKVDRIEGVKVYVTPVEVNATVQ